MFRKILIGLTLAVAALSAYAGATQIDTSGLTEAQVAELKAHAARAVADAAKKETGVDINNASAVLSFASTWGQQASAAAEGFARALGIAARELGVTVNDFLHTDAGKLTAMLIIWKVAGAAVMKSLYGVLFITIGLTVIRNIFQRLFTLEYKEVQYSRLFGAFTGTKLIRVPKNFGQLDRDGEWFVFCVLVVATIAILGFGSAFFL